jgi:hypothetical protein
MRSKLIALAVTAACVLPAYATTERTLTGSFPAEGIAAVVIDAGAGDVKIAPADGGSIEVEVLLTPRRGGIFSSMARAEREVEEAAMTSDIGAGRIYLGVDSESGDRRFEERWIVFVPAHVALELDVGLGDVIVESLSGGVELEIGVGEVTIEDVSGDIVVELGVGEVTIRGDADRFGAVNASGGIGDATLRIRGERIESEGLVGHSSSWKGDGEDRIDVEVGVGDARITLK